MPGLLQPISIHFMAGNTAGVILFYMRRSPLINPVYAQFYLTHRI